MQTKLLKVGNQVMYKAFQKQINKMTLCLNSERIENLSRISLFVNSFRYRHTSDFLKLYHINSFSFLYVYKCECQTNVRMHSLTLENTVCNSEDKQDTESSTSIMGEDTELVKPEGILES